MDGRLIFLIIALGILAIVVVFHILCTHPYDFEDWFIGETAWAWILGTIVILAILFAFIFWSWLIMTLIFGSIIILAIIIASIIHLYKNRKNKKVKNVKISNKKFERNIYKELDKLIKYPNVGYEFITEKTNFEKHLNNLKKKLDCLIFKIKEKLNNINQTSYIKFKEFFDNYPHKISELVKEIDKCKKTGKSSNSSTFNFFKTNYNYLNESILSIKEDIYKAFMLKNGKVSTKDMNSFQIYKLLPDNLLNALNSNIQPYIDLYLIENFLRIYINIKYYDKYKNYDLDNLFKFAQNSQKKAFSRIKDDEKQGWTTPRGQTIVFYVDFSELSSLITNSENWNLFKEDFKDQDFIKLRINELYNMRNKIAHNSVLGKDELNNITSWCNQIYNQLSKYKKQVRNWKP